MNYLRPTIIGLLALAALLVSAPAGHAAHINPTVIATVPVGSFPVGVAVNPTTNRVYVANAGSPFAEPGNTVSVIDGASNAVVATVPVGDRPIGVAVNPSTDRVYVANIESNTVSVIDGASNAVVATIPVGHRPSRVGVNPSTDRVYVSNSGSNSVSVIDGVSNTVIATISVGSGSSGVGVNPTTDRVYVANQISGTVSVIDGVSNTVVATIPVVGVNPKGPSPVGVGVNPSTGRVYVSQINDDTVSVIDGASNTVVATIPVGLSPIGVGVNPATDRVYAANADGTTVSVIADPCPPPPPGSTFCDVTADHWAHPFIEATVDAGITAGCSPSPPLYCPDQSVTRAQMAVFIILALNETPVDSPTGVFDDVPPSHWAAGFIEKLAQLGITSGCSPSPPLYCPNAPVTRAQMAVFIVVAWSLPLP